MIVNPRTELPCKSLNLFALALLIGMTGAVMRGNAARATAFGHERPDQEQKLSAEGVATLRKIIDTANHPDLRWPDFAPYREVAGKFYEAGEYSLAWIQHGKPTTQAVALVAVLRDAGKKG